MDARLKTILELVPRCKLLFDIGCDHGKVAVSARLLGLADKVIATDISAPSLQKARNLAETKRVDNIDFVVTDGVNGITEVADVAVIAGMGGHEIAKILSGFTYVPRLILGPHRNPEVVRDALAPIARIIEEREVTVRNKRYIIIVADKK